MATKQGAHTYIRGSQVPTPLGLEPLLIALYRRCNPQLPAPRRRGVAHAIPSRRTSAISSHQLCPGKWTSVSEKSKAGFRLCPRSRCSFRHVLDNWRGAALFDIAQSRFYSAVSGFATDLQSESRPPNPSISNNEGSCSSVADNAYTETETERPHHFNNSCTRQQTTVDLPRLDSKRDTIPSQLSCLSPIGNGNVEFDDPQYDQELTSKGKKESDDLQNVERLIKRKRIFVSTSEFFVPGGGTTGAWTSNASISIPDMGIKEEISATAHRKTEARKKALVVLITILRNAGVWEKLLRRKDFHAELSVDDDLLWVMDWARNDLLCAEKLAREMETEQPKQATPRRPPFVMRQDQNMQRSKQLMEKLNKLRLSEEPISLSRKSHLPVNQLKQPILDLINRHTYSIIVAETGSGKSTQVPQLILDEAIKQDSGGECRVLCVQPRRIAAKLLANRVAQERDESIGDTVGYAVRFDYKHPVQGGTITYCTTGIMLNMLQSDPSFLRSFSHIILDEVHVRDVPIDLVMLLLKRQMEQLRVSGTSIPKVIIMSATVDVNLFSSYFPNYNSEGSPMPAPHISVPGRQHHVKTHYLDEILDEMTTSFERASMLNFVRDPDTREFLRDHYQKFGNSDLPDTVALDAIAQDPSPELVSSRHTTSDVNIDEEDPLVPLGLICGKIIHILTTTPTGSILIFLPGLKQILTLEQQLQTFANKMELDLEDESRFQVLKLHAQLPDELDKLSLEVPPDCRRILLSTDVAEASITLPDVNYVIDSGKVHQLVFDPKTGSSQIICCWASKSSAIQRAGRAGRVRNGQYYFFGTKACYDSLRITKSPEIVRADLQHVCLRAKQMVPDSPLPELLEQAIEPPSDINVREAVRSLKQLQALDQEENITNLGQMLALLPISPASGKLILLGVIFRCLDPLLVLGVLGEEPPLFRRGKNSDEQAQIRNERLRFAEGTFSDHVSLINGFSTVRKTMRERGRSAAFDVAFSHNISFVGYLEAAKVAGQILSILNRRLPRLVPPPSPSDRDSGEYRYGGTGLNTNSENHYLIRALVVHCLLPRIAAPSLEKSHCHSTNVEPTVRVSLSSAAAIRGPAEHLVAFSSKFWHPKSGVVLNNASVVSPLMVCLFGGRLTWDDMKLCMDSWMHMGFNSEHALVPKHDVANSLIELHKALDQTLAAAFTAISVDTRSYDSSSRLKVYDSREALFASLQRTVSQILARDKYQYPTSTASSTQWDEHDLGNYVENFVHT